jgi:hypothetical protein
MGFWGVVMVAAALIKRPLRTRAFMSGLIESPFFSLECTLRNTSEAGAMIQVASSDSIPDLFTLAVPEKGLSAQVRVIWRKPQSLGLELVGSAGPPTPESVQDHQASLISALMAQNAQLQAELAALRESGAGSD